MFSKPQKSIFCFELWCNYRLIFVGLTLQGPVHGSQNSSGVITAPDESTGFWGDIIISVKKFLTIICLVVPVEIVVFVSFLQYFWNRNLIRTSPKANAFVIETLREFQLTIFWDEATFKFWNTRWLVYRFVQYTWKFEEHSARNRLHVLNDFIKNKKRCKILVFGVHNLSQQFNQKRKTQTWSFSKVPFCKILLQTLKVQHQKHIPKNCR